MECCVKFEMAGAELFYKLRRPSKSKIENFSYTVSTIGRVEPNSDWAGMDTLKVCVPTVA